MRRNRWWAFSAAALLASAASASAEPAQEAGTETVIRGTVVDEADKPVAGASVELLGWDLGAGEFSRLARVRIEPVPTGPDGGFLLRRARLIRDATVRASADGGARLGFVEVPLRAGPPVEPVRLVLKPSRPVTVRVADAVGKPVAGAAVEVMAGTVSTIIATGTIDPGTTDERGIVRFRVPADSAFHGALALKDGVGVDWFVNGVAAPPAEISLVLRGTRTITARAVDTGGRPIPGIVFRLGGLTSRERPSLRALSQITAATTDASGVARWRWVPEECSADLRIDFMEELVEDKLLRLPSLSEGDMTLSVRLSRRARLSGRVVNADGSPARGVTLRGVGVGSTPGDSNLLMMRSGEDGSYSIAVRPGRAYLIAVDGPGLTAAPIQDIFIGEGERRGGLDFRLIGGTRLHGRVAVAPGGRPFVGLDLLGEELPPDQQPRPGAKERLRIQIQTPPPDAQGNYEVRLGPGDYQVYSPSHRDQPTIHVDGTGEFVLNFLGDTVPPPKPLTGVVVEADPGGAERPVKAATIEVASDGGGFTWTNADEAGRFTVGRFGSDIGLYAYGAGKVAAVKVARGVDEVKVVLGPSATATGRIVDAKGRPFTGEGPSVTTLGGTDGLPGSSGIRHLSTFEPGGRYTFKGLAPGVEYKVSFILFRDSGARDVLPIKTFRVPGPGPIDLGEFVVPAERPAGRP